MNRLNYGTGRVSDLLPFCVANFKGDITKDQYVYVKHLLRNNIGPNIFLGSNIRLYTSNGYL